MGICFLQEFGIAFLKYIDHTGDTGIDVSAESVAELFETCARGMFEILIPNFKNDGCVLKTINLQSDLIDTLMVDWLSELNFIFQTEQFYPHTFDFLELTNQSLCCKITGSTINAQSTSVQTEIKAVTYHHLKVEQKNSNWHAHIIFDI